MANEKTLQETDDMLLPDGWEDGTDIFSLGDSDEETTDASSDLDPVADEADEAPTTETEDAGDSEDATEAPTTEPTPERVKFQAKVDHRTVDVDLDPSELPSLYQRAQVTDRVQAKLKERETADREWAEIARILDYPDAESMRKSVLESYKKSEVKKLVEDGVNETVAEETIENRVARKRGVSAPAPEEESPASEESPRHDYTEEIRELFAKYPETAKMELPPEVTRETVQNGVPLIESYERYLDKQSKAVLSAKDKEIKILKQNAASAAKAPVSGVRGGGAVRGDTRSEFDKNLFKGFDSAY